MTEQLHQRRQTNTQADHLRGEGVPQRMRGDGGGATGALCGLVQGMAGEVTAFDGVAQFVVRISNKIKS